MYSIFNIINHLDEKIEDTKLMMVELTEDLQENFGHCVSDYELERTHGKLLAYTEMKNYLNKLIKNDD